MEGAGGAKSAPAGMMRAAGLIIGVALLAGSCTAAPSAFAPESEDGSLYGAFLAARYAGAAREPDASARFYAAALSHDPQSEYLSERAFYSALLAGDFDRADAAAPLAARQGGGLQLAHIYLDAARLAGARVRTDRVEPPLAMGPFGEMIGAMLDDWKEVAAGRDGARRAAARAVQGPDTLTGHILIHRALLLEVAGEHAAAEVAYRQADASLDLEGYTTALRGAFLERRGRADEALRLYERHLSRSDNPDPEVVAGVERINSGARAPRPLRPSQAAARALFAPSALLAASAPVDYAALYLRLVQRLDPDYDRNTMYLASTLERLEMQDAALAAYAQLEGGPFAMTGMVDAAWLNFRLGRTDDAIGQARHLADADGSLQPRLLLADLYRMSGECRQAVPLYREVIDRRESEGREPDWRYLYFEGVCHQIAGDWESAEARFLSALEIDPDEPRVLNHLGYNWIVLNTNVEEGFELVRRAAEIDPENGAILDSLGWGHFKQGRFDEAVEWLERAAALSPDSAVVNWHLGDAYAAVGRDREAGFQWRRARDLEGDARVTRLVEQRLEGGLSAGPADIE